MEKVWYRWSEKGKPDLCEQETFITTVDRLCYHCGRKIYVGSQVVLLKTERKENYILHQECADKSCLACISDS